MVNTEDFVKRLEIILEYYSLNASSFADKIGVQRSSMSHLLSGRNKPSLDFILKITDFFPEIDLYWIINGKGVFPKSTLDAVSRSNITSEDLKSTSPTHLTKENIIMDLFSETTNTIEKNKVEISAIEKETLQKEIVSEEIEKIVFFYKNGTFKIYSENSK